MTGVPLTGSRKARSLIVQVAFSVLRVVNDVADTIWQNDH
jgi:hypothetical protein